MNEWTALISAFGGLGAVAAIFVLIVFRKYCSTDSVLTLIVGLFLILMSAWQASALDAVKTILEGSYKSPYPKPSDLYNLIDLLKLVIAGATLSVGSNLIAAWFTGKPEKPGPHAEEDVKAKPTLSNK